jgi:amino acid adenylation domain-containing protein/thioester reductase-like protein
MSHVLLDRPHNSNHAIPIAAVTSFDYIAAEFALRMPSDNVLPAAPDTPPDVLMEYLPDVLVAGLRHLPPEELDDLSAVLLTAFTLLLSRYTRQDQIRVDIPIHAPDHVSAKPLDAPPTSATIDIDLAESPPFAAVLRHVCERLRYAVHGHDIAVAAASSSQHAHTVTFTYQRLLDGPSHRSVADQARLGGDLRLDIVDTQYGVLVIWVYHAARFAAATIARMCSHLQILLAGIAANPARSISQLPILTDAEQYQLLIEWNNTATDYPANRGVHELFEAQVARTPDALALIYGAEQLTYRALNRRANRIARQLQELGVAPDVMVGLCVERSPEQVASVLGILKAGGAYVPLDPTYPPERLALMLQDTQTAVLLIQRHLLAQLPTHNAQIICVDDETEGNDADDINCDCAATADNLAYVIYTSGSTGVPKGVLIDRRGLTNHTCVMVDSHDLDASDRILLFVSLSFDASAAALFPPLLVGATLVLPEVASSKLMGDQLTRLCAEQQVTIVQLPASVWHQWVDDLDARGERVPAPLKTLLVGGENPSIDKLRAWARLTTRPMTFLNAYGPTEATITTTLFRVTCDDTSIASLTIVPMGRPLANMHIYLLDARMQPVPIGVPGEVYIGGVGLARGYLNQPELTAECFVKRTLAGISWAMDDGHGCAAPARLYKTGDLARYHPDGNIEFLGRIDEQVKLRGFRIELGEIEAVLQQHPAVKNAVVQQREDVPGVQRLVAYVVTDNKKFSSERLSAPSVLDSQHHRELTTFLSKTLPRYMIPSAFVRLKVLPLTSNGKVDRRALPAPEVQDIAPYSPTVPRTPEEAVLVNIWAKVLGRQHVGIDDDFFALGGHSLLAARAIALVKATLHRDVPPGLIFEAPTVAAFAQAIRRITDIPRPVKAAPLIADVVLDTSISAPAIARPLNPTAGTVFLTGTTGFLGAFLLHEILAQTRATLYCLVRAADAHDAGRRIYQSLTGYQLWRDDWQRRIVPIVGDLREAQFGLDTQTFQYLSSTIDVIYHAGAQVHYLHLYDSLKATNVGGTVEILRLACQERLKPIHYISTLAVGTMASTGACVREADELTDCTSEMGYIQSKWVAEGLLHLARARGLPVAIYRPARISWHTKTAAANVDDFFVRLLAGCLQLGLAPDVPMVENLVPVDYIAQAIVHLSQRLQSANKTFHLQNLYPTTWQWVVAEAQKLGYPLKLVPYREWFSALRHATARDSGQALHTLLMLMPQDESTAWIDSCSRHTFDTQNTMEGLAGSDLRCPAIDAPLLKRMLVAGVRRGIFVAPATRSVEEHSALVEYPD